MRDSLRLIVFGGWAVDAFIFDFREGLILFFFELRVDGCGVPLKGGRVDFWYYCDDLFFFGFPLELKFIEFELF